MMLSSLLYRTPPSLNVNVNEKDEKIEEQVLKNPSDWIEQNNTTTQQQNNTITQ